jgi:hypothetical protein
MLNLSHPSNPLFCGYFGDRISFFAQAGPELQSSYFELPSIAGMTGLYHHTQLFSIEMVSYKLFFGLV